METCSSVVGLTLEVVNYLKIKNSFSVHLANYFGHLKTSEGGA